MARRYPYSIDVTMRRPLFAALALLLLAAAPAIAQKRCVRGIPCGRTCISATKTCRIGTSTATRARTPPAAARPSVAPPADAQFVASSRGQVYYYVGCTAWKSLSAANLRWFKSVDEAVAAGYRPSASRGCAGPTGATARAAAGLLTTTATPTASGSCVVAEVTDGDTLECDDGTRIRLLLIDAPEIDQRPYGMLAKTRLVELAPIGTALFIETDVRREDPYGRLLAHLRRGDGVWLNHEMISSGMAVVAVYPPNVEYLTELRTVAEEAQRSKRGMWATSAFECAPADFRAGNCQPGANP